MFATFSKAATLAVALVASAAGFASAAPAPVVALEPRNYGWPASCTSGVYGIPTDSNGVPLLMTWTEAGTYCSGIGTAGFGGLAGDTTDLNVQLGDLIDSCNPPGSRAWIGSWNGDWYQGTPLFMMHIWDGSGYSVYADLNSTDVMAALCVKKSM
ncbi:hypothetical protein HK405_003550 [Cladochytrium tenue]|nr:hypothetical protein HK405_003550 [Cladochytrium tenue]